MKFEPREKERQRTNPCYWCCSCVMWAFLCCCCRYTALPQANNFCICNVLIKMLKMAWIYLFFALLVCCYHIFPHCAFALFACWTLDDGIWTRIPFSQSVCAWWMPISNTMDIEFYCFVLSSRQMCSVYVYHTLFNTYMYIILKAYSYSYATVERQATWEHL